MSTPINAVQFDRGPITSSRAGQHALDKDKTNEAPGYSVNPVADMETEVSDRSRVAETTALFGAQAETNSDPAVSVEISGQTRQANSPALYEKYGRTQTESEPAQNDTKVSADAADSSNEANTSAPIASEGELEQAVVQDLQALKQRDTEVRSHEEAHAAVGGSLAGQPSYDYVKGPDGKQYAVSGEVSIDVSAVPGDPVATIDKMRKVRDAALAPADPSTQDRKVAAQAAQTARLAQSELVQERLDEDTIVDDKPADDNRGDNVVPEKDLAQIQGAQAENPREPVAAKPVQQPATQAESGTQAESKASTNKAVAEDPSQARGYEVSSETTADSSEEIIDASLKLFSAVNERNAALDLFEATQSLYENIEDLGGNLGGISSEPGSLVNTLV